MFSCWMAYLVKMQSLSYVSVRVQGNMLGRLPKKAQNYIASSKPDPEAPVEIRAAAHRELHEWLMANRSWVFPVDAQAPCTVHGRRCYMNGWMKVPEPLRDSEERPSIWNIAGITCHAWSAEGNQEGLAHPSAVYHSVWHCERVHRAEQMQEDGFFFECTPLLPAQELVSNRFSKSHFCIWVYADPISQGFPSRRRRVLCFAGNRLTTEWLGPAEGDVSEDYHKLFGRTIEISGACLLCDSDDNRWEGYQVKTKGRGHDLTIDELRGLSRSELMTVLGPPGFEQRYDEWTQHHHTHVAAPGFLADVDHHPVTGRNSGGMLFPVQLTHGSIVEFGGGNSDSASSFSDG